MGRAPRGTEGPWLSLRSGLCLSTSLGSGIKCLTQNQSRAFESLLCVLAAASSATMLQSLFTYMESLIHLIVDLFPEVLTNETCKHRETRGKKKTKAEES